MKRLLAAFAVILAGADAALAAQPVCEGNPAVVGECFAVHGRLTFPANMRPKLWPIGTKRLLEASTAMSDTGEVESNMPARLRHIFARDYGAAVFGDYRVCPLTKEVPGWMQIICIQSASHLVVVPGEKSSP